jgi:uncharacterized membrane protein (DUF106 family)
MNGLKKNVAFLALTLVMLTAVALIAGTVSAQGSLSCRASVSAQDLGVSVDTAYTFTISNDGQTNLGAAKVAIPQEYTNIRNLGQPSSQNWNITLQDHDVLLLAPNAGLTPGQDLTFTFEALNPQVAGTYTWNVGASQNATAEELSSPEFTTSTTSTLTITSLQAAVIVFFIAAGIAVLNTVINRLLIGYFVGWEQYRVMQKEMTEYRNETMAAARANDTKRMEKLKKRKSQIDAMQSKMMKPQMVQFAISFLYLFVWFLVLTPTYGGTSMVYIPGIGPAPVFYWYPICSLFLGLNAQRLIGVMPIEQR